jgi:NitT/TauT family transport system substrate-binding protein
MLATKRFGLLTSLIFAITCSNAAFALDKVTFRLDWVPGAEFAPIYLGKAKGFFTEQNLDIDILPGEGSTVSAKLVGNQTAHFGLAAADVVMIANSRGLPITSIGIMLQEAPGGIIFPTGSGIKTLTDLYGRKLGIQLKSSTEKQWRAVAKLNGIDETKITEIPADRAIAQLIANNTIDAGVAFYFNDGLKLVAEGTPMSFISFADNGLNFYGDALICSPELIKSNPDLVDRFTRAFVKSWTYALAHESEALSSFLNQNPAVDPKYSELKLPVVLRMSESDDTRANGFGHSVQTRWDAMQQALIKMQLMNDPVDVSKLFTNEFLK